MSTGVSNDSIEFRERVRSMTDLVGLIGESLTLIPQRGGQEYVGLCPFHDDHNPSMRVYPDRQSFRCWVCEEGGDCFAYVMKREGVGFRDALEQLAQRAGLEMPKQFSGRSDSQNRSRERWYGALAWAEREFHQCFLTAPEAEPARRYMRERGFTEDICRQFRVGFQPGGWSWLLDRCRGAFREQELQDVRLIIERKSGNGYIDFFRGRVMFPIHDIQGRAVAFGGRILPGSDDDSGPKYLNSQDSPLFVKSSLLYGLHHARDTIRQKRVAVVAEGYTDCIMCHQAGVANVVAPLGTALTDGHVSLLKRYAPQVVVVFDGDDAGQRAAERVLGRFLAQDVDLRIMVLPGGADPADFLLEHGGDAFRELAEQAGDVWDFKLTAALAAPGADSVDGRRRIIEDVMGLVATVPRMRGSVREDIICRRVAERMGVTETSIRRQLEECRREQAARTRNRPVAQTPAAVSTADAAGPMSATAMEEPAGPHDFPPAAHHSAAQGARQSERLEREALEVLLTEPRLLNDLRTSIGPEDFLNRPLRRLFETLCDLADEGLDVTCDQLLLAVEDAELKRIAVGLDESARHKNVSARLRESQPSPDTDVRPRLLTDIIDAFRWNRQQREHELVRAEATSQLGGGTSALDAEARELLRQQASFHALRARKRTSN